MKLTLQMLGTGNAFAKKYYNNNALLYANEYTLMIDCGITAPLAMHELNKPMNEVDGLLITHLHADHVGGIEELAFQLKYVYQRKIDLFVPELLVEPLWENCLKAGMQDGGGHSLDSYFNVHLLKPSEAMFIRPDLKVEIIRTEHIPDKISYSLYLNDFMFYSADMIFQPDVLHTLIQDRQCTTILHDCQLHGHGAVHTTLDQLKSLPDELQQRIWLMHYNDDMEDFIEEAGAMRFLRQHQMYIFER